MCVCVRGATRQVKLVIIQRLLKNAWLPKMVVVSDSRARLSRYGSSSVKRKTVNSIKHFPNDKINSPFISIYHLQAK